MVVKLLSEHDFEFLSLKEAAEAHPSQHLSKCQIVGKFMPRLINACVANSVNPDWTAPEECLNAKYNHSVIVTVPGYTP